MTLRRFIVFVGLVSSLVLFSSCSQVTNNSIVGELNSSLVASNEVIGITNKNIVDALRFKTTESITRQKAGEWLPKAEKISELSSEQNQYLDKLKNILRGSLGTNKESTNVLSSGNNGNSLFQNYKEYLKNILSVDSNMYARIGDDVRTIHQSGMQDNTKGFTTDVSSASKEEVISFITKLQNNIVRMENKCLAFCFEQIGYVDGPGSYTSFEAILGQNAKIVKAGDELEITTGLGSFDRSKQPKITVGEKIVAVNERGFGVYKFRTSKKLGEYSLPVKIEFIDQDGKPQERRFTVEYTLVEGIRKK